MKTLPDNLTEAVFGQNKRVIWDDVRYGETFVDVVLRRNYDTTLGGLVVSIYDRTKGLRDSYHLRVRSSSITLADVGKAVLTMFNVPCGTIEATELMERSLARLVDEPAYADDVYEDPRLTDQEVALLQIHRETIAEIRKEMESLVDDIIDNQDLDARLEGTDAN